MLHGEKARFRQVFQNLIDNAIKYMGEGQTREIHVGCAAQGVGSAVLRARHRRWASTPEDLGKVFCVFRRGKNSAACNVPGKGVGLASVKSIVETYGGTDLGAKAPSARARASNSPSAASTLPSAMQPAARARSTKPMPSRQRSCHEVAFAHGRTRAAGARPGTASTKRAPPRPFAAAPPGTGAITILLVDDDPDCRLFIRDAIAESKVSNSVYEVADGKEALDFLHRRGEWPAPARPGLIYLDIEMPGMDGLEVLRQIKADKDLRDIPVVMMTGVSDEAQMLRAAELGANSYTIKPANATPVFANGHDEHELLADDSPIPAPPSAAGRMPAVKREKTRHDLHLNAAANR